MKQVSVIVALSVLLAVSPAHAAQTPVLPTLDLEKQIASEQGRFGAIYAQCGSHDEQAFIGGSLTNWRSETFRGYHGSTSDLAQVQKAFDTAAVTVKTTEQSCTNWSEKAATAWSHVVQLADKGKIVAAN